MRQGGPALREYAAALKANSNRFRGLYGAAMAAQSSGGDAHAAADYFTRLLALAKNADSPRLEIARAKAFLERQ
jgi:cytochrome c-type biogenesis protein CcmH/NrfG